MSEHHARFVSRLRQLAAEDRSALAALRRSLSFAPGTHAPAMKWVEPFAVQDGTRDAHRLALYVTAGLFAANPRHRSQTTLAQGLALAKLRRKSDSIERRFIALLSADAETLPAHLRHAMALLAADEVPCDFEKLADDLALWLDPWRDDDRDRVRQRWARDFYRALASSDADHSPNPADSITQEESQ